MDTGNSIKDQLKEISKVLAGVVFKARTSRLSKTIFDVHLAKQREKNTSLIEKQIYNEQQ